jgi:Smg protein
MFDVLVYLYETYNAPEHCPDADTLARKLSAAGFEDEDIGEALNWLTGLARATEDSIPLALAETSGFRVYAEPEHQQLGAEAIGFIAFLESAEVLSSTLRELVIERAMAIGECPVPLDELKVIVLMVLWSQEADIDNLILEELLEDGSPREVH